MSDNQTQTARPPRFDADTLVVAHDAAVSIDAVNGVVNFTIPLPRGVSLNGRTIDHLNIPLDTKTAGQIGSALLAAGLRAAKQRAS